MFNLPNFTGKQMALGIMYFITLGAAGYYICTESNLLSPVIILLLIANTFLLLSLFFSAAKEGKGVYFIIFVFLWLAIYSMKGPIGFAPVDAITIALRKLQIILTIYLITIAATTPLYLIRQRGKQEWKYQPYYRRQ